MYFAMHSETPRTGRVNFALRGKKKVMPASAQINPTPATHHTHLLHSPTTADARSLFRCWKSDSVGPHTNEGAGGLAGNRATGRPAGRPAGWVTGRPGGLGRLGVWTTRQMGVRAADRPGGWTERRTRRQIDGRIDGRTNIASLMCSWDISVRLVWRV